MRSSPITLGAVESLHRYRTHIMGLLTLTQKAAMRKFGAARARGEFVDIPPVVKLYTPDSNAVWLLTELDADGDLAYGLCDVGLGAPELGHVRISDLMAMRGPHGFAVAVDKGFVARQPLSAYAEEATRDGSITG